MRREQVLSPGSKTTLSGQRRRVWRMCASLKTLGVMLFTMIALQSNASGDEAPVLSPYQTKHEAPLDATVTEDKVAEAYTRYHVEFNGIRDDRVPAYLYLPRGGQEKTYPAVLLQYGSGGNKNTNYIVAMGEHFAAHGFVVLTIDVPNRGERHRKEDAGGGSMWVKLLSSGGTLQQTMGDYSRAVDYLTSRPDVDQERIGYAGISLGAITGIPFVAHDSRIKAVASIVGGGNLLGMFKVPVSKDALAVAAQIDPFYHVGLIAPRPLLLLNVTHDQLIPRFFSESLHRAAGDTAKKVWLDTDHFFQGIDRAKLLDTVIGFMQDSLASKDTSAKRQD